MSWSYLHEELFGDHGIGHVFLGVGGVHHWWHLVVCGDTGPHQGWRGHVLGVLELMDPLLLAQVVTNGSELLGDGWGGVWDTKDGGKGSEGLHCEVLSGGGGLLRCVQLIGVIESDTVSKFTRGFYTNFLRSSLQSNGAEMGVTECWESAQFDNILENVDLQLSLLRSELG